MQDTIFARASGAGRAGVMVVRVSGPQAHEICETLVGDLPAPFRAALRDVRDPGDGALIDQGLVLVFPEGRSFTGEQAVEFQLHGSLAVERSLDRILGEIQGVRRAEAGEFTRRALENGRMDLTQVEGLADLLQAETEAQRRQALAVQAGALSDRVNGWRQALVSMSALLASVIDFSDEEVPDEVWPAVDSLLQPLMREIEAELAGSAAAERLRDGFDVVIVGAPNVGKSTILNRLARREAALVSDQPGTTRDLVEVRMDLFGLPVTLIDTAGLRETEDRVEAMGIARAEARAQAADLRVILVEGESAVPSWVQAEDLVYQAKADLAPESGRHGVSGLTGAGVDRLLQDIGDRLRTRAAGASLATRERHRVGMAIALDHLRQVAVYGKNTSDEDLAAEELRSANRALAAIVGAVDVEDVLGEIFSTFCIGK